uniref:Uncharacterized protein n=1 Tax=Eutreptiella gymnastica TaxID=73025 RepID=A0A7S4G2J1_9EUGL|mmetsp:Transcript_67081/g.112572  ORF Transcript_67081/g.112572 Transcript_67081/m.112572 type:complete len:103 (-) Transcript_67081:315-623(-)
MGLHANEPQWCTCSWQLAECTFRCAVEPEDWHNARAVEHVHLRTYEYNHNAANLWIARIEVCRCLKTNRVHPWWCICVCGQARLCDVPTWKHPNVYKYATER